MDFDYASIKQLAKQLKRPVTSLIALASANDPFYQSAPRQRALAEWFANIYYTQRWDRFRNHIRRCHYQIVSLDLFLPSGKKYENSHDCWRTLLMASKAARYLGVVPMDTFDDHRNDEPISYVPGAGEDPQITVRDFLFSFDTRLPEFPDLPGYEISEYKAAQRYHTEIWCFPGETLVQTITGPKPISTIQKGELVLTHKGRYQPVTATFQHHYSGNLVRVRSRYSARDVRMTPNHLVLTLQGRLSHGSKIAKELAWVPASDLVVGSEKGHYRGDFLAFPRVLELPTLLPIIESDVTIGGRANGSGGVPFTTTPLPIDVDVAWMLGFFVGDGHVGKGGILFALHAREQEYAAKLIAIGSRLGIRPSLSQYGNTLRVRYNAIRLTSWFRQQFGGKSNGRPHTGSRNKRIPSWIITAPAEITQAFLQGYWEADGTQHAPRHQSIVTSSLWVAEGIRLILIRFGYHPTLLITRRDGHYIVRWGGRFQWGEHFQYGNQQEDYLLFPIRDISTEPYEGSVYNLEVAEDNSYITEFAVHNCEKTSVNDVLLPLAEEFGAVLQTGAGELSISLARLLAKRLQASGKPARIFYISDYDPAGQSMPVAVARKLEFFIRSEHLDIDARLFPLVLSRDQVQQFALPRTPIKPTERRREAFEKRHGEGAVELDALEALVPGELERIVRAALSTYHDSELDERVAAQREEMEQILAGLQETVLQLHSDKLAEVRAELEQIRADLGPRMEAYTSHLEKVWHGISQDLHRKLDNFGGYGLTQADVAEEFGSGLYDSQRDYLIQMAAYKQFQGKERLEPAEDAEEESEDEEL